MSTAEGGAVDAVTRAFEAIERDGRRGIWITLVERDLALRDAARVDASLVSGHALPLAGMTFGVKDNIDVAGVPTTAACPAFAYTPQRSAASVRALVELGAIVIGKTNLDQFATGLVGTRSPYGTCPNAWWPPYISGGSSSGSAVAVAAAHVDFALGTDTAGSGRIPAACNGIIGIKPTRGRVSAVGVVPACRSLDCVTVFARSIDLAAEVASYLAATTPDADDPWSRGLSDYSAGTAFDADTARIGIAAVGLADFDGDERGAQRFAAAVNLVAARFSSFTTGVDVAAFVRAGEMLYDGAFVAERYDAVGEFVTAHLDDVDPIVRGIVVAAAALPAWQAFRDRTELRALELITSATWATIDVLVVPSAPRIPTVDEVLAAPLERNTMLGRFTNFVNLLDLCALTLPTPTALDDALAPPTSITLIARAGCDEALVSVARRLLDGRPANHHMR